MGKEANLQSAASYFHKFSVDKEANVIEADLQSAASYFQKLRGVKEANVSKRRMAAHNKSLGKSWAGRIRAGQCIFNKQQNIG